MPDDRRFAILWMSEKALASAYDLDDAFSSVSLKLLPDASEAEVIKRLDTLLDRYGGQAAYGRRDQFSHAYINHGMDMLRNMSQTLPPIFLLVSAFLINLTLTRIVALEREQIGLFKALGYSNRAVALHYIKLVMLIVAIGFVVGAPVGTWLVGYVTKLYRDIVHFPFLIFAATPGIYVIAGALSLAAASLVPCVRCAASLLCRRQWRCSHRRRRSSVASCRQLGRCGTCCRNLW
jgi:putative ABC transport system permease protein